MGSKRRISATPTASGMPGRRPPRSSKTLAATAQVRRRRSAHVACPGAVVSDKLETIRNLIRSSDAEINPDQLLRATADYIVLLKARVFVLQKLVGFYGSQPQENRDAA